MDGLGTCRICLPILLLIVVGNVLARGPYFVVLAPSVIRFNHEEQVVVSVLGINGRQTVYLQIEIFDGNAFHNAYKSALTVTVTQDEPVVQNISITETQLFTENEEHKPKVATLVAWSSFYPYKRKVEIPIRFKSGYIFVQTDKPIYYPRDRIKYRTLCLNEGLQELNNVTIAIDVFDPVGLLRQRRKHTHSENGSPFFQSDFTMPTNPRLGTWTLGARFLGMYETQTNASFEVQEYKLPTFGVSISTENDVILEDETEKIVIHVTSKYVYKENVQGSVILDLFLRGTSFEDDLFLLRRRATILNGVKIFEIEVDALKPTLENTGLWFPTNKRLLVYANVTEQATGNRESATHFTTIFSPFLYTVSFPRTRLYYQRGMSYYLKMDIAYLTGRPITTPVNISITCNGCGNTRLHESAFASDPALLIRGYNTDLNHKGNMEFSVSVANDRSAVYQITVQPYNSDNSMYLDIDTDHVGMTIQAFNNIGSANDFTGLVAMLMYKGGPLQQTYQRSANKLDIIIDMLKFEKASPSARFLAFYIDQRTNEIVADSLKLNNEKKCQEQWFSLQTSSSIAEPGDNGVLTISGNGKMHVGLNIMDKALLLRNNKNILLPESLNQEFDRHDLGCGQGGGSDIISVLENAGLKIVTNANLRMPLRDDTVCNRQSNIRKRRSPHADCSETDGCCQYGWNLVISVKQEFGNDTSCLEQETINNLRLLCYKNTTNLRERNTTQCALAAYSRCMKDINYFIDERLCSRFLGEELNEYMADINEAKLKRIRSNFDESWLFREVEFERNTTVSIIHRDSITEWMTTAIGFSKEKGVCIANVNFTTFTKFFVQLDLPYSAVRLEHLDIKVTVFNYGDSNKTVRVYMEGVNHICSGAEPGMQSEPKTIFLKENSAKTVRFPIVPLQAGSSGKEHKFDITIRANDRSGVSDSIRKSLYVKNEGILVKRKIEICLNPDNDNTDCQSSTAVLSDVVNNINGQKTQFVRIDLSPPQDAIANTAYAHAMVTGNHVMIEPVQTVIKNVGNLIKRVTGCGEQSLRKLAPGVYAMKFLKNTNTMTARDEASGSAIIRKGVTHILKYITTEGSFSYWRNGQTHIWLTSRIIKVLCQAEDVVTDAVIKSVHVTPGLRWLANQHNHDGRWEQSIYRTAEILIGLLECSVRVSMVEEAARKVIQYLDRLNPATLDTRTLSRATYALALAKSSNVIAFKNQLVQSLKSPPGRDMKYIGRIDEGLSPTAYTIENTAFGLLAMLEFEDFITSAKIVKWLMFHRLVNGAFRTTSATWTALQALSEYNIKTFTREVDLTVAVGSQKTRITSQNVLEPQTSRVNILKHLDDNNQLFVTASGSGKGRLVIDYGYNRRPTTSDVCNFIITDTTPVPTQGRNDRKKRQAAAPGTEYDVQFNVSTNGTTNTGMAIIDFGLQTGFTVLEPDLEKMREDNVIDSYDMPTTGDGFVVLYLESVKVHEPIQIQFRLKEIHQVTMRQPAMLTVYDYYSPEITCKQFYSVDGNRGKSVEYDCPAGRAECRCLQSKCATDYLAVKQIRPADLKSKTCTLADYAVIVDIIATGESEKENYMEANATVRRVLKKGRDQNLDSGSEIHFRWRSICQWPQFKVGSKYVVIAMEEDDGYPLMKDDIVFERKKASTTVGRLITRYVKMMSRPCTQ